MKLKVLHIIITITCWYSIMWNIGRHSVHPYHGNVELASMKCHPWDSCR